MNALREPLTLQSLLFALTVCSGFIAALFALAKVLPGKRVEGMPMADGKRRTYEMNGLALFVATHMFLFVATYFFGLSLTPLLTHFWALFVAANIITMVWLVAMFAAGKRKQKARGEPPEHGPIAELWYGCELNPELWGVDLKIFAYQPSLIGLGILNVAFAYAQYEQFGHLTTQMWLYQGFWWVYLATHYHYESGVLSMWDIIAEKFGFMLLWGDLVLVPFFYCIGGWWLVSQTTSISTPYAAFLVVLFGLGIWIFRGSNDQKNRYKRDKSAKIWGRDAETVGGRLLISGFWGIGRKLNYTGEIMVYSSFALTTGFSSVVPFLLPLWLCILLPHRAWRDETRCKAKYGDLWDDYTRIAKFRMIPFVY